MNDNDRSIIAAVVLPHALVHTYELSIPILVPIWLDAFSVTAATIGLVVAAGYGLFGVGALPGGALADRYGSRTLIVGCLAGMTISFLLLGLAPSIHFVAFALLVWGAAASVYHPAAMTFISKGATERGAAFGYHGMAGNIGIALGPLATAVLLLVVDWQLVLAILSVPAVAAILIVLRFDFREAVEAPVANGGEEPVRSTDSFREFVNDSKVLFTGLFVPVFGAIILFGLYYRGVLTFLPDILAAFPMFRPIEWAGRSLEPSRYFFVGLLMVGVIGQYVGGKSTDRFQTERTLIAGFVALSVLAVVFLPSAGTGLGSFIVVGALLGVVLFGLQPIIQSLVSEYTPTSARGLSFGYMYLGVFGVGALGAAIAGSVLEYFSPAVLFVVLAAFALGAAAIGVFLSIK